MSKDKGSKDAAQEQTAAPRAAAGSNGAKGRETMAAKPQPRWDFDQDLAFREWWNSILNFVRNDADANHESERYAAGLARKLLTDRGLRKTFAADPASVLEGFGLSIPEGLKIKVAENTASTMVMVLPAMISEHDYAQRYKPLDLADEELESFVTGAVAISLFQDDFDVVRLRDNRDHDVDVLPFQTNATGDKFKTAPFNRRNDIFGA